MENITSNLIIIGDTHFGIKNNSMTWLVHQKEGFEEILEYIKESMETYQYTCVVHVGDLFDSRSSINPLVWREVKGLLEKLNNILTTTPAGHTGQAHIIGGNHDYYYPWESPNNFSGVQTLPEFSNIGFHINESQYINHILLVPWFNFHNRKLLEKSLEGTSKGDIIITHTDPIHMEPELQELIKGYKLITGHIHQPTNDWKNGLLVTGASFATDFTDTNSQRGFWTITNNGDPEFHAIGSAIHFHTITEENLENWKDIGIKQDDCVEILIKQSHIEDHKNTIKELVNLFGATTTPIQEETNIVFESAEVLNVDTVCNRLLPEKLKIPYQQMVRDIEKRKKM